MFLEILLAILLGVLAGCFTGLLPGIHTNLVAIVLLSSYAALTSFISGEMLIIVILSMSITHSFISSIPSIYLGAPEGANIFSVLPGHRMLLEGKGYEAVKLTLIGSVAGLVLGFAFFKVSLKIIEFLYTNLQSNIPYMLIAVSFFLVLRSNSKLKSLFIFGLSGLVGFLVLDSRMDNPLFPLLTGFFGTATLLFSLRTKSVIPKQVINTKETVSELKVLLNSFIGFVTGFLTCILPGLGSSTAATISSLIKKSEANEFLILVGSISTVNFFMSIAALYQIDKARNGSIVVIKELVGFIDPYFLVFVCLVAAGIAGIIGLFMSKKILSILEKINYEVLVKVIVLFLLALTIFLTGFIGLLIVIVTTSIGFLSNLWSTPRNLMMACILVPVIIFLL